MATTHHTWLAELGSYCLAAWNVRFGIEQQYLWLCFSELFEELSK